MAHREITQSWCELLPTQAHGTFHRPETGYRRRFPGFVGCFAGKVVLQLWNRRQLGSIIYELGFNSKHTNNKATQW